MPKTRVLIMGRRARFHNFDRLTATTGIRGRGVHGDQIPDIEGAPTRPNWLDRRTGGIPIYAEEELDRLIRKHAIDEVVFSHSTSRTKRSCTRPAR